MDAYLVPVVDGFAYGLLLFTVAAGLTVVFGIADVLNLAHGLLYTIGGYAAVVFGDGTWTGLAIAIAVGIAAAGTAGALLSAAVAPLQARGHLPQALLTFGVALAGGAALIRVFGAQDLRPDIPTVLDASVQLAGHHYPAYRLAFIAIAALLVVGGWLIIARTKVGARVRAMADDREMLAVLGVNPRWLLTAVLAAGGGLAGLAGVLGAPIIGPGPHTADTVLLLSLMIVVIGWPGSLAGAFWAAIAVGQVQSLGVVLAPNRAAPYLLFAAMAAVLITRRPNPGGRSTA